VAAFKAIHDLGVLHGDIREDNIMVLKDGSVRIIDFEFSVHEGVTKEHIDEEDRCIQYMFQQLEKEAKAMVDSAEFGGGDMIQAVEGMKELEIGEEALLNPTGKGMEIHDIARAATPIIPGKNPEGTDGEEEDSDSSDTDSTW
jgi:serine/threonine protein kinase